MIPVKEEIPTGTGKLLENYFKAYKLLVNGFKLSFMFMIFVYYVFCALNILVGFVLIVYVFIEVAGGYTGTKHLSYVVDVISSMV